MSDPNEDALRQAVDLAQRLAQEVSDTSGDFTPIWDRSDEALALVEKAGYSPHEFISDSDDSLGFGLGGPGFARRFFRAYAREVRASLCGQDGDLRSSVGVAISGGTASLLSVLANALAVPLAAVGLLAPIAAILLIKGVD